MNPKVHIQHINLELGEERIFLKYNNEDEYVNYEK
jgi:hypothetical protein